MRQATMSIALFLYVGSLSYVKENYEIQQPIPSDKRQLLNHVIKTSGWLITVVSYVLLQKKKFTASVLTSVVGYTVNWFLCTTLFNFVKSSTEYCAVVGKSSQALAKDECLLKGFHWYPGYDISGHVFLLTFSVLVLFSQLIKRPEANPNASSIDPKSIQKIIVELCVWFYVIYCLFMLTMTSLYYHEFSQKVVAATISISSYWFFEYVHHRQLSKKNS